MWKPDIYQDMSILWKASSVLHAGIADREGGGGGINEGISCKI